MTIGDSTVERSGIWTSLRLVAAHPVGLGDGDGVALGDGVGVGLGVDVAVGLGVGVEVGVGVGVAGVSTPQSGSANGAEVTDVRDPDPSLAIT
jgi:hypothetical protein